MWRKIEELKKDYEQEFVILRFNDSYGEPCIKSGFYNAEYDDFFDSECASCSMTVFNGQPIGWMEIPAI